MPFSYCAYGLRIASDRRIPGLSENILSDTDISLFLAKEPSWLARARRLPSTRRFVRFGEDELLDPTFMFSVLGEDEFFRLDYSDGTHFIVDSAATHIWGAAVPSLTIEDLTTCLVGPVMGFILRQRGILALHASSVVIEDRAVVLAGPSEAGKSTTAAALTLRGHGVLCEDIAAIVEEGAQYFVEPGYPRVCLWPDSVERLMGAADMLPLLTPNWEKRYLPLEDGRGRFASKRQPLGAIYVLGARTGNSRAPWIEPLSEREALLELVQNTYMNYLPGRTQRAAEFEGLSRLVERVAVQRIIPHADASRLTTLCDLVVEDAHRLLRVILPAAPAVRV